MFYKRVPKVLKLNRVRRRIVIEIIQISESDFAGWLIIFPEKNFSMLKNWVITVVIAIGSVFAPDCPAQSSLETYLTRAELEWLAVHPKVRVAPTPNYPPFEFWEEDEHGELAFKGVVRSYLDYFSEQLGVEFEYVRTEKWEQNLRKLKTREIDAVSLIVPWTNRPFVTVSKPYISYPSLIIVRKDEVRDLSLKDLIGEKVAVPNDYTGEYFLRRVYPDIEIVEANGPAHGVRMVSLGEVKAFFGGASVVTYVAETEGITNLRIAGETDFVYNNGFGVRDDWGIFAGIISKTLDQMTPAQHREYYAKWVTTDFFRREYYDSPRFWWILISSMSVLLFGSGIVLFWNRRQAALINDLEAAQKQTQDANRKLDQARREAEAASRAKSSFVANISHEIRTPMNGVLGMCELLKSTQLTGQQLEYLDCASSSAENLLNLINDILDFSKIEAGKLVLESRPFSIHKLLDEAIGLMKTQAKPKSLRFIEHRGSELAEYYEGDALRIRQILLNLLSNAVKFTEEGTIAIRVDRVDTDGSDTQLVRFEVEDTGIGVSPEKLSCIFQPFEQEDATMTRRFGGTGLGLAICKTLAEMMGGTADAASEIGKGSLFGFTASLKPTQAPDSDLEDSQVIRLSGGRRVLLAEDGLINQKVAIGLLEKRGHQVDLAENGQQALDAIEKHEYDIVLMDIQMPVMDGLTAVKILREREQNSEKHLWVVAMTAHAMSGDRERFMKAGMDGHLTKPFKPVDLYTAVELDAKL